MVVFTVLANFLAENLTKKKPSLYGLIFLFFFVISEFFFFENQKAPRKQPKKKPDITKKK